MAKTPEIRSALAFALTAREAESIAPALASAGLLPDPVQSGSHDVTVVAAAAAKFATRAGIHSDALFTEAGRARLIALLSARFCGVPDSPARPGGIHIETFGAELGKWKTGTLKVGVVSDPIGGTLAAVKNAFTQYQNVQPFFSFTFPPQLGFTGNINVRCGGNTLTSAFQAPGAAAGIGEAPESGSLMLNSTEPPGFWNPSTLLSVVLHEAGHVLGLSHSTSPTSVMYPISPTLTVLDAETITAIQNLYGWIPQIPLGDRASTDGPSLAVITTENFTSTFSQVFSAWKGTEGDWAIYMSTSNDGRSWSPQVPIPGIGSSQSPTIAPFTAKPNADGTPRKGLFMAWKGEGDDRNIWFAMNSDPASSLQAFGAQRKLGSFGTTGRPALAEFNGQMVMAWKGVEGDSAIYWSQFNFQTQTWTAQQPIAGRGTSSGVALAVFQGQLHMFWKGIDGDNGVYRAVLVDPGNGIWGPQQNVTYVEAGNLTSGQTPVGIGSSDTPSVAVRNNQLVLAWKGVPGDHAIYYSFFDGSNFTGQFSVLGIGTEARPSIASLGGRLVLNWRGIGDDHSLWATTLG